MAIRLHVAIAIEPLRIFRVVAKVVTPDNLCNISHPHRVHAMHGAPVCNVSEKQAMYCNIGDKLWWSGAMVAVKELAARTGY